MVLLPLQQDVECHCSGRGGPDKTVFGLGIQGKRGSRVYESFRVKAEGVGAEVFRFPDLHEAVEFILRFLVEHGVCDREEGGALWADGPFLKQVDRQQLSSRVPGLTFSINREAASRCMIGISEAEWGVADTGSLVADQAAVEQRLVSSLPPIHIALLGSDRILSDKRALFSRLRPPESRYIAFITGPSRTADIERVLTIGVHGPKRLVIVVVDGPEGAAA